jgi:uncharacterized surface protein with fasciclin (FAS1) repeats
MRAATSAVRTAALKKTISTLGIMMLATVAVVAAAPVATAQPRNCIDTLAGLPEFSRFVNAVTLTHVGQDFRQAGNITVFAPTNDAVRHQNPTLMDRLFPRDDMGNIEADPVLAPAAIGAHVVVGRHGAAELARGQQFNTVAGTPLRTMGSGETVTVQGAANIQARVTRPDIACSNGVIQGIDAVLIR